MPDTQIGRNYFFLDCLVEIEYNYILFMKLFSFNYKHAKNGSHLIDFIQLTSLFRYRLTNIFKNILESSNISQSSHKAKYTPKLHASSDDIFTRSIRWLHIKVKPLFIC